VSEGRFLNQSRRNWSSAISPTWFFTVFYSSADFKEKLKQAKIPSFDLGYFGTIESIKEQILLMGDIIGEESNALALVKLIETKTRELKAKLP